MSTCLIGPDEVAGVAPQTLADALESAFRDGLAAAPLRSSADVPGGSLLLMPAADAAGSGVKVLTLLPANPGLGKPFVQGSYLLFDRDGGVSAVIDAAALTAVRTAAVSAVAARHLAPHRGGTLMVLGAGVQARAHLRALTAELEPDRTLVWSRREPAVTELVAWGAGSGFELEPAVVERVEEAAVVCTCTGADRPLFDGRRLRPGALAIAIGAYRPDMRELDTAAIVRSTLVVEQVEAALAEAGDLLTPIAEGRLSADRVSLTLTDVIRGAAVRERPERTVVFKSVGVAGEDLAAARALLLANS